MSQKRRNSRSGCRVQRGVRTKNTGVAQREAQREAQGWRRGGAGVALAHGVAQGWRRGGAGVAQGLRRGCAGVAQVWRRCGAGVTSTQQPTAIKTATTTTTATIPNKRPDRRQRNQAHGQTRRPGRGRWCSIASPPAPCVLCLAERRRLAVAGMSPRRNRPPPALRTPSVPFTKPHRATAGRRASFAALRNAMSVIGTVSSDHRFRPARAIASGERAAGLLHEVGYIACHARQTRHARRSSRARTRISSPLRARHHRFPPPPRTTGTRALLRRRRSLDRSIARTGCGVGGGGGVQLHRASRASRARACTSSPRIARVITAPLPRCHPCARAAAAAALSRLLACSRARWRRRWGWGRRWRLRGMTRALTRALTNRRAPHHSVRV